MIVLLRFSTEKYSLLSALIRWRTESKVSHVEFELAGGWTFGSRLSIRGKLGRKFNIKRWQGLDGVQLRPPTENRKQSAIVHATFLLIDEAYRWGFVNRCNYPYDTAAIMGIITARGCADKDDRFCSEFVDECAQAVGVELLHNSRQAMTPRDILISPQVTIL